MSGEALGNSDLARLFCNHANGLRRFLISRGIEPDAAMDVSQEAFLRLMKGAPSAGIQNPKGYLFRIAANIGVDLQRLQARAPVVESLDSDGVAIADTSPGVERVLIARQEIAILARAFDEVPPGPQKVFLARLDGMTFAQIETKYGVPVKTAFSQVMKVTLFLKSRLDAAREIPAAGGGQP